MDRRGIFVAGVVGVLLGVGVGGCQSRPAAVGAATRPGLGAQPEAGEFRPDPWTQKQLHQAASLLEQGHTAKAFAKVWNIRQAYVGRHPHAMVDLMRQAFYTVAHPDPKVEEESLFTTLIAVHFWKIEPRGILVAAAAPWIDVPDPELRKIARGAIRGVASEYGLENAYGEYGYWLRTALQKGGDVRPMIELLYTNVDPGRMLLKLADLHHFRKEIDDSAWRQIQWAEHVISDALWKREHGFLKDLRDAKEAPEQLEQLIARNQWWVRRYVAQMLRRHAEWRTPELMERLKQDPDPQVRKMAEAMGEE